MASRAILDAFKALTMSGDKDALALVNALKTSAMSKGQFAEAAHKLVQEKAPRPATLPPEVEAALLSGDAPPHAPPPGMPRGPPHPYPPPYAGGYGYPPAMYPPPGYLSGAAAPYVPSQPPSAPAPAPAPAPPAAAPAPAAGPPGKKYTPPVQGFVFPCEAEHVAESLSGLVFGMPEAVWAELSQLPATKLPLPAVFLLDANSRTLYGVFVPRGAPGKRINAAAFGGSMPAQCQVARAIEAPPVALPAGKPLPRGMQNATQVRDLFTILGVPLMPASSPAPAPSASAPPPSHAEVWQWLDRNVWKPYEARVSRQLAAHRAAGKATSVVRVGTQDITVDFAKMTATSTRGMRKVRVYNAAAVASAAPLLRPASASGGGPWPRGVPSGAGAGAAVNGYVFICNNKTKPDVMDNKLFGLPGRFIKTMSSDITPATILFLVNKSGNIIHGCFQADGHAALNIVPTMWSRGGPRSMFPAQLRFKAYPGLETRSAKAPKAIRSTGSGGPLTPTETATIMRLLGVRMPTPSARPGARPAPARPTPAASAPAPARAPPPPAKPAPSPASAPAPPVRTMDPAPTPAQAPAPVSAPAPPAPAVAAPGLSVFDSLPDMTGAPPEFPAVAWMRHTVAKEVLGRFPPVPGSADRMDPATIKATQDILNKLLYREHCTTRDSAQDSFMPNIKSPGLEAFLATLLGIHYGMDPALRTSAAAEIGKAFEDAARRVAESASELRRLISSSSTDATLRMMQSYKGTNVLVSMMEATGPRATRTVAIPRLTFEDLNIRYTRGGGKPSVLLASVFSMSVRYGLLGDLNGHQSSVPQEVFDFLHDEFGVRGEAFASPLNIHRRCNTFFSLFPDTDGVFGSQGSFFQASFASGGSFLAFPPDEATFVERTVQRFVELMRRSVEPLSFVLVLTRHGILDLKSVAGVADFLRQQVVLPSGKCSLVKSVFTPSDTEGLWAPPSSIGVYWFQNDSAHEIWPPTFPKLKALTDAWVAIR